MTPHDDPIEDLLRADGVDLTRDARLPSAGLVYWRASIRARSEAARKAEQPFTVVQGLAAAAVAGVGAAFGGLAWRSLALFESSQLALVTAIALGLAALVVISPLALIALGARRGDGRHVTSPESGSRH